MRTADDILNKMSDERRERVERMASELIAEEMTLSQLRKALKQTQKHVAKELGINQNAVSKLERRSDLLLSTLNNYVSAMGGELKLVAEFPDNPPVSLAGLLEIDQDQRAAK